MLLANDNSYQACMMAPTEILAQQHFNTLTEYLGDIGVRVDLLTGSVKGKERKLILENLKEGKISINSPFAKGLLGKVVGDIAQIQAPAGVVEVEVLEITV